VSGLQPDDFHKQLALYRRCSGLNDSKVSALSKKEYGPVEELLSVKAQPNY